jgi:hypothetical protein
LRQDQATLAADMLSWAAPLVRDRIAAFWDQAACRDGAAERLCDLHWRVWRCALSGLPHGAASSRRDLVQLVRAASLPAQKVYDADEAVIDEIAEVIVARYRRSPNLAKDYTRALVLAAAGIIRDGRRAEAA